MKLFPWKSPAKLRRRIEYDKLSATKLFDREWYLAKYSDVREARLDPIKHYLAFGASEGRDPHPLFDGAWYLAMNPDVRVAGVNPLLHYLEFGAFESRSRVSLFLQNAPFSPT
jgi:hypothetical protein